MGKVGVEHEVDKLSCEEIKNKYLELNEKCIEYEKFLIQKLGRDYYITLWKEFTIENIIKSMKELGMKREKIDQFKKLMEDE